MMKKDDQRRFERNLASSHLQEMRSMLLARTNTHLLRFRDSWCCSGLWLWCWVCFCVLFYIYPGNNIHVSFQCIAKPKGFGTCANLPI